MQGRLLPKVKNRYQSFPLKNWKKEFFIAKKLKLDLIEFIFDIYDYDKNPLFKKNGSNEINKIIKKSGVKVKTVCADFFMHRTLFDFNKKQRFENLEILKKIIINSKKIGVTEIVVPLVDNSSINKNIMKTKILKNSINSIKSFLKKLKINLCLETDLPPKKFVNLIKSFKSQYVKINYDTGNSASLGYVHRNEMKIYGKFITDLHIKDRKFMGGSVHLGLGNVDFNEIFASLQNKLMTPKYIIFQTYRDNKPITTFKKQFKWYKEASKKLC